MGHVILKSRSQRSALPGLITLKHEIRHYNSRVDVWMTITSSASSSSMIGYCCS